MGDRQTFWSSNANSWLIHWKSPQCWERLRAEKEGIRGWDGCMALPMKWTWTWANLGRWEGQRSLACCSPWGHKELDTTGRMNKNKWGINTQTLLNCLKTAVWYLASKARRNLETCRNFQEVLQIIMGEDCYETWWQTWLLHFQDNRNRQDYISQDAVIFLLCSSPSNRYSYKKCFRNWGSFLKSVNFYKGWKLHPKISQGYEDHWESLSSVSKIFKWCVIGKEPYIT